MLIPNEKNIEVSSIPCVCHKGLELKGLWNKGFQAEGIPFNELEFSPIILIKCNQLVPTI